MGSGFLKSALVGGIVGAFVAAGTTALATTQVFTLGTSNQVDAASTVAVKAGAAVAAPLVSLSNTSTGAAATPLALTAASNHPALTVNTKTRVVNLDADLLDAIDSKIFAQGLSAAPGVFGTPSTRLLFERTEIFSRDPTTSRLMTIPGIGHIDVTCGAGIAYDAFVSDADGVDLHVTQLEPGASPYIYRRLLSTGSDASQGTYTIAETRFQGGTGQGSFSGQKLFTIDMYADNHYNDGNNCFFQATASLQTT